jgi:hypothetical protein
MAKRKRTSAASQYSLEQVLEELAADDHNRNWTIFFELHTRTWDEELDSEERQRAVAALIQFIERPLLGDKFDELSVTVWEGTTFTASRAPG